MKKSIFLVVAGAIALSACYRHARTEVFTTGVEIDVHHHHHHHHHHD